MDEVTLTSWGNNITKEILLTDEVKNGVINFGNQNSYGDCFIPKSSYAIINKTAVNSEHYYFASLTINELVSKHKFGLYGVPGKSNVTLGGAIASDTHGKDNIWGGSFEKNIKELFIQLPSKEQITVSKKQEPQIYESTIGGYGLSGSILGCNFHENLPKFTNSYIKSVSTGSGIEDLLANIKFKNKVFTVCWIDLLSKTKNWVIENYTEHNDINKTFYNIGNKEPRISFPFIGKNTLGTMSIINRLFLYKNKIFQRDIVSINKVLYPLGLLTDTRNLSNNRKIVQVQFSIPDSEENYLEDLIDHLIYNQFPILCSLKKLENSNKYKNLSFHQNGWAVAVDFPYKEFNNQSIRNFYKKLIEHNGKVYLAKDSTLNRDEFRKMYPEYNDWIKVIKQIDPKNIYQSALSDRLGLKTW